MDSAAPINTTKQLAFLPWLRLKTTYCIAGVEFVPLRDTSGTAVPVLADAIDPLKAILSSYIDRKGQAIDDCVVATIPGRGWNQSDSDFPDIEWAASLLFLACWASNKYFSSLGPYVNSSAFRVVGQRFSGEPHYITLLSRRRDGNNWDDGYKHGEVKFSAPPQCLFHSPVKIDDDFFSALDRGNNATCNTIQRLRTALPFVSLANTDDTLMTGPAEAILMASAFEQLLRGDASAYKLGRKFGTLFKSCGTITVEEAQKVRSGIEIDVNTPERADAQKKWGVHQKWIEELYALRNKSVHKGRTDGQNWVWEPWEHLLMAAWVFPLTVKLLLQRDGHYTLSDHDEGHCLAVDKLLAETDWRAEMDDGGNDLNKWQSIVRSAKEDYGREKSNKELSEKWPQLCPDNDLTAL